MPDLRLKPTGLLPHSRWQAVAQDQSGLAGFGSGATDKAAGLRARMELVERAAQFLPSLAPATVWACCAELSRAVDPRRFGLYAPWQYTPELEVERYDSDQPRSWLVVDEVATGEAAYVPTEFVYPHAVTDRIVVETSSGTAAAPTFKEALTAGLCELLERDALLRWWYRQECVRAVARDRLDLADVVDDLAALDEAGFVSVIVELSTPLDLPCFAALVLQGDDFFLGAACAPIAEEAIRHAVRELGQTMNSWIGLKRDVRPTLAVTQVRSATDHHMLYRIEPYNTVVRTWLEYTIRSGIRLDARPVQGNVHDEVFDRLAPAGLEAFSAHLPSSAGVVVRALVPGLIPWHLGYARERLGHPRLGRVQAGNRIRTLLPHPFG